MPEENNFFNGEYGTAQSVPIEEYNQFTNSLKENKDSPEKVKELINGFLEKGEKHYDKTKKHGNIALDNVKAYETLMMAKEGETAPDGTTTPNEQVPYAICSTIHEVAASALNDAGIKARAVVGTQLITKNKEKLDPNSDTSSVNHIFLIYESEDGKYVVNNYKNSTEIEADNFKEAYEMAVNNVSPELGSTGGLHIYTPNGNNVAYNEVNIGRMLPEDIDRNSGPALNAPFKKPSNSDKSVITDFDIARKTGDDKVFGSYNSSQVKASVSKPNKNGETNIALNYGNIQTNNGIGRKNVFNTLKLNAENILTTSKKTLGKDENLSVRGSLYSNFDVTGILSKNEQTIEQVETYCTSNIRDGKETVSYEIPKGEVLDTKRIDFNDGDYIINQDIKTTKIANATGVDGAGNINILPGASLEYNTDNVNVDLNAYSGVRLINNNNLYQQTLKIKPEFRAGAKLNASYNGDNGLNASLNGSVHQVNASTYSNTIFGGNTSVGYANKGGGISLDAQAYYKKLNIYDLAKEQTMTFSTGLNGYKNLSKKTALTGGIKYDYNSTNNVKKNQGLAYNLGLNMNF